MKLKEAIKELNENKVYEIVREKLDSGTSPVDIISECNEGMVEVGELFSSGKYFLTELMFSAEIMKGVMEILEPLMSQDETRESLGKVVIGTVEGDIHDIGKNIVVNLLQCHGFEVTDLGVDVPADAFVKAVRDTGAKVLGLSALLNSTYPEMKTVVDALTKAGLREDVKVIIGGTVVSEAVQEFTGADAYARDAMAGVNFAKTVYGKE